MVKGSFQLRAAVITTASGQYLYEDNQGGEFKLLPPFQGQKPDKPRVFKYLHMKTLTYAYKDTEGNEYQQLQKLDDALTDEEFMKNHMCEECGISHLLKDCPIYACKRKKRCHLKVSKRAQQQLQMSKRRSLQGCQCRHP